MIRPYKHIRSNFHSLQSFVNHLFLEVIFKAPKLPQNQFDSSMVLAKYQPLIDDVNDEYLLNPLKEIYKICRSLNPQDLKVLKRGVHVNNKIRLLCNGELSPVDYEDINNIDKDLSKHLKTFFDKLYDEAIKRAIFYSNYQKIDDYYNDLVGRSRTCRACGINKVLTKFHSKRSALDHYLPRNHFPFTSINCNNLVPICDTCNSKYKLGENTIFEILKKNGNIISKTRKKAFYPYSKLNPYPDIELNITFKKAFSDTIEPGDLDLSLGSNGFQEQVSSWDRLFGIKENYLAECCTDDMYIYYEQQYVAEMSFGKTHAEYIESLSRNKFGDMNFLKIAFLEGINNY